MSERMPNERWAALKAAPMWGKGERDVVRNELDRARREEAQQQDRIHALEEKDATIMELAKVLVLIRVKYEPVLNTGHVALIDEVIAKARAT